MNCWPMLWRSAAVYVASLVLEAFAFVVSTANPHGSHSVLQNGLIWVVVAGETFVLLHTVVLSVCQH